jgi:hypothetical protein
VTTLLQGASEGFSGAGGFISIGRFGGWLRRMRWNSKMGFEPIGKDPGFLVLANTFCTIFPDQGEQLRVVLASAVTLAKKRYMSSIRCTDARTAATSLKRRTP